MQPRQEQTRPDDKEERSTRSDWHGGRLQSKRKTQPSATHALEGALGLLPVLRGRERHPRQVVVSEKVQVVQVVVLSGKQREKKDQRSIRDEARIAGKDSRLYRAL